LAAAAFGSGSSSRNCFFDLAKDVCAIHALLKDDPTPRSCTALTSTARDQLGVAGTLVSGWLSRAQRRQRARVIACADLLLGGGWNGSSEPPMRRSVRSHTRPGPSAARISRVIESARRRHHPGY
jgi:hypothetical protein